MEMMADSVWVKFDRSQFTNKCSQCGKTIEEGSRAYGTKNPAIATKGKWYVICPRCKEAGVRTHDAKEHAAGMIGRFDSSLGFVPPKPPPKPPPGSDVETIKDLIESGVISSETDTGFLDALISTPIFSGFGAGPGAGTSASKPSSINYEGIKEAMSMLGERLTPAPVKAAPATPSGPPPWSLRWIAENATWRI